MRVPIPGSGSPPDQREDALEMNIGETNLNLRTINMLESAGIITVKELLNTTKEDLLDIPNFGKTSLRRCYAMLADLGFTRDN